MQLINMSYKGFCFKANPSSIKMELSKSISEKSIPFKFSKTQEICFLPMKISGSGSFVGEEARQFAHKLMHTFKSSGSGYLFTPDFEPTKMFFSDLNISYKADKSCVDYSFSFVEDCEGKRESFDFGYTYAEAGENLYDVANRTDVPVEKIFECNKFVDLFSISEGDKIWLC